MGFANTIIDNDNFLIYTEDDGLINNSIFGIVEDNKKNLWISTSKGISKFNKTENLFTNFDQSLGFKKVTLILLQDAKQRMAGFILVE